MSSTYGFKSRLAHQQRDAAPNSRSSHLWWSRTFLPALAQHLFRRPNPRRGESLWLTAIFILKIAATPFGLPLLPAKSHAAPPLFACKRAHNALACYQLFAEKGKGVAFSFPQCPAVFSCGELRFCHRKTTVLAAYSHPSLKIPERPLWRDFPVQRDHAPHKTVSW